MKTLAIELSSEVGGVALLNDVAVVASAALPASSGRSSALFDTLEQVGREAGWAWEEIDLFAAGRGPGRYSGMRVALTVARALALPGDCPVRAVSSGAALAHAWAEEQPDRRAIAVVGDARRERIWYGVFVRDDNSLVMEGDWALASYAELAGRLPDDALLVSSEWSRLQPALDTAGIRERAWVQRDIHPTAEWVGRLAHGMQIAGAEAEPLSPIYLHPPVQGGTCKTLARAGNQGSVRQGSDRKLFLNPEP